MLTYDKIAYKTWLEINSLEDNDENEAAFVFSENGANGIGLYKALGRECRHMTAVCYPVKLTVEEFVEEIRNLDSFVQNMKNLESMPKRKWAEDWMETLQAWIEMEKGDFD